MGRKLWSFKSIQQIQVGNPSLVDTTSVGMTMRAISNKLIKTSCPINHHHTLAHLLHVSAEISAVVYQAITIQNKEVNCNP